MLRGSQCAFLEGLAVFWPIRARVGPMLSGDSCGRPEPPGGHTDQALEVMREVALIREAGAGRDFCQGEIGMLLQELLCPLDAVGDDVLVWWLSGRDLELPSEVIGAEMRHRRHSLQGQVAFEVFLDVLDDCAELGSRERSVPATCGLAGRRDVSD